MSKSKKFVKDEFRLNSLLTKTEFDYFRIIDENTDELVKPDEVYEEYLQLIIAGVSLYKKLIKRANKFVSMSVDANSRVAEDTYNDKTIKILKKSKRCSDECCKHIFELYDFCERTNRFWHNCSMKVYENYYPSLKEAYKKIYPHSTELDFLRSEYETLIAIKMNQGLISSPSHRSICESDSLLLLGYQEVLGDTHQEFFEIQTQNKMDFIANKILEQGFYLQYVKKKKKLLINLIPEQKTDFEKLDEEILEISTIPNFNLIERYELLKRMGIDVNKYDTNKKSKNKILALIIGCSVDNARKLIDGTYKVKNKAQKLERQEEIDFKIQEFLYKNDFKL